jgi:hypothetical protein
VSAKKRREVVEPLEDSHPGDRTDELQVARAVVRSVKHQLPSDEFEVDEDTLFLSSQAQSPTAAFAVVLLGIPSGLIAVDFKVSFDIDATADGLVAGLLEARATVVDGTLPLGPWTMSLPHLTAAIWPEMAKQELGPGYGVDEAGPPPQAKFEEGSPVTLDRSGAWLLTTRSGARLLVVVVVDPSTKSPIVTITRYAAVGYGDEFNGAPLSVDVTDPPRIGMRWHANVIATDSKYSAHDDIVYGGFNAVYMSTPVTSIRELTYEMLVAASPQPGRHVT